jgi:phage-related minor tail protein
MLVLSQELEFQSNKEMRNRKAGSEAIVGMIKEQAATEEYAMQQWSEGWDGVFDDWGDSIEVAEDKFAGLREGIIGMSGDMSSAFADFAMSGKASVKDMIDSMIKDFIRFAAQKAIFGPLMGGLAAMLPGAGGVIVNHTGSDSIGMTRKIPRLHNGLRANEYPAILERGEGVDTKEQVRAGGGGNTKLEVIVVRGSGAKTKTDERQDSGSGIRQLMIMVGDDIARGGPVAQTIEGTYSLVRKGRVV